MTNIPEMKYVKECYESGGTVCPYCGDKNIREEDRHPPIGIMDAAFAEIEIFYICAIPQHSWSILYKDVSERTSIEAFKAVKINPHYAS
jgi:hypothetical protein